MSSENCDTIEKKLSDSVILWLLQADEFAASARIPSKYQDDSFLVRPGSSLSMSRPSSSHSITRIDVAASKTPIAPQLNPTILSTNPLPASQMTYALAASGMII